MKQSRSAPAHFLRNDILFIASILLLALLLGVYLFFFRPEGETVTVTVDGQFYGVYSLAEDRVEDIHRDEDASAHNRFVIRDGEVFMEDASCPDGICVGHRPISRSGESIVCLPNRVVITVHDNTQSDSPDIVA